MEANEATWEEAKKRFPPGRRVRGIGKVRDSSF
jgi:hypothetical protein